MKRSIFTTIFLIAVAGVFTSAAAEAQLCLTDSLFILNDPTDPTTTGILDTSKEETPAHTYYYNAASEFQYTQYLTYGGTPTVRRDFKTYYPDSKLKGLMSTWCWIANMGKKSFVNGTYNRLTYDSLGRVIFDSTFTDNAFGESINYYESYTYNTTGDTAKINFNYYYYEASKWKVVGLTTRVIKDDSLVVSEVKTDSIGTTLHWSRWYSYKEIAGKMVVDTSCYSKPAGSGYPATSLRKVYSYDSLGNILSEYNTTHTGDYSVALPVASAGTVRVYYYGPLTDANIASDVTALQPKRSATTALSTSPARLVGRQLLPLSGFGKVEAQVYDLTGRRIAQGALPLNITACAGVYIVSYKSSMGIVRQTLQLH